MTSTLHDAIAAVRAGEMERAQLLAANIVQNNPNDPNAWYLLSQLVDSDARRAAYLSKTLALDPAHPRAAAEFASLPPKLAGDLAIQPAAVASPAIEEIEAIDEMIHESEARVETAAPEIEFEPAYMPAGKETAPLVLEIVDEAYVEEAYVDDGTVEEETVEETYAEEAYEEEAVAVPAVGSAPEWLQPLGPQPVAAAQPAAEPAVARSAPAAPPRRPAPAKKSGNQALTLLLGVLGLLTILVMAFLLYLLFFN